MINDESKGKAIILALLGAIISIIPFITYLKVINLNGDYYKYWKGETVSFDFFSYYKSIWLLILTVLIFICFLYIALKKEIQIEKTKIYIPLIIYGVFVILSTVLSQYKTIALWGFVERWEGMLVILAYLFLFFIAINFLKTEKDYKNIIYFFIVSAVIMGTIGIFQYFGHDLLKTDFIKKLMLPSEYDKVADSLKFQFDKGIIYTTLYHYNYVGSYMAMLFPMTFVLALFSKNKIAKTILCLISLLMFANLISSQSRAGVVGGVLALVFLLTLLRKKIINHWKIALSGLGVAIVIFFIFNNFTNGTLINRISSLFIDATKLVTSDVKSKDIKDVVVKDNKLSIIYPDDTLNIIFINNAIELRDTNDKKLEYEVVKDGFSIKDSRYKNYLIGISQIYTSNETTYAVGVNNGNLKLSFVVRDNIFKLLNHKGEEVDLLSVPYFGFEGKEKLGSARTYIWSRTIPLLKNTVFKGNGPDTFAIDFPQNDYIGKYKAYGTLNMFVDKPHNLYIQTAINTGVISLLAMLALFGMYIVNSFKIYFNNELNSYYSILGLAIFVAVIGYLGAGFFNDSVVSVAPVFWVLLGMGVSINIKLLKKETENV